MGLSSNGGPSQFLTASNNDRRLMEYYSSKVVIDAANKNRTSGINPDLAKAMDEEV